jgi:hypothetical protein
LKKSAGELPGVYIELKESALEFTDLIEGYEIPQTMEKSSKAAENQDGRKTLQFATLALEKMKELMENKKDEPFGGLCNQKLNFNVSEKLKSTMEQMLEAIGSKPGAGSGDGGMIGGDPTDGYWSGGYSPMNVPVMGPERMSYQSPSDESGAGDGSGKRGAGSARMGRRASEVLGSRDEGQVKSGGMPMEAIPEKYRNAIKKYFSAMEEKNE